MSSPAAHTVDPRNPWLGLASFTEETRSYFHGRDEEVGELSRRVQRRLLTVLFGQSGLGKTSILRAGIVPRLRPEGYCPVYVRIDYGADTPPPSEQIKQAILRATREAGHWTRPGVASGGETLWEFLHHRDDLLRDASGRPLLPLLIFDQFEEIFTLAQGDESGRRRAAAFIEDLADLVENRAPRALEARLERDDAGVEHFDFARSDYRILIALREDYLAHLEGLKDRMPSVTQNRMRLARMTGTQAISAVTGPGGGLVNADVAAAIVRFVSGGGADLAHAEVEPSLLSLVCRELNNTRLARSAAEISADLLAGSRDTILFEFYERVLGDQPAGVRAFLEDELLTDSGYRESVAEERVRKGFAEAGAPEGALAVLVDRRLLRVEERLDLRRVEFTHDVLAPVIRRSRDERLEREAKAAMERQLAATREKEDAARRALWRARMVAGACGLLAIAATGGMIYGRLAQSRAESAERAARQAAGEAEQAKRLTEAARAKAEDLLGFVLTDLEEQLTDFGQLPIQLDVSRTAVAYYAGLPPELRNTQTRLAHARALANLGAILDVQGKTAESHRVLDEAVAMFEEVAKVEPLPPAKVIEFARILTRLARLFTSEVQYLQAIPTCDRAEQLLAPLLDDPAHRPAVLRVLAGVLDRKGFSLLRSGRAKDAVPVYQRALASAEESDRLAPGRRPGLLAAALTPWLGESLRRANRSAEAAQITEVGRSRLLKFVEAEPFLMTARRHLAYATSSAAWDAAASWDFAKANMLRDEYRSIYQQMLKLDSKNTTYINNLGISYGGDARLGIMQGNVAEAERAYLDAIAILSVDWATPFMKMNIGYQHAFLGVLYAGGGRDAQADEALVRMRANMQPSIDQAPADSREREVREEVVRERARDVEVARLNWKVVRAEGEASLRRLDAVHRAAPGEEEESLRRDTHQQLALAAMHSGDFPAARRHLSAWWALRPGPDDQPTINSRFLDLRDQLVRIEILFRAGEAAEARALVAEHWPEVEAVFKAAPEEFFNQVQYANALWIRAEVDAGLVPAARRELLARAAGLLRPLAQQGKLMRRDREWVLAGIERELAR
jgi:tetratricopeptide (TPR) repeat protein